MAVTHSSNKTLNKEFVARLAKDFADISFEPGAQDHWSPRKNTITYKIDVPLRQLQFSLLHELAHAQLGHTNYRSDFELLKLESEAWQLAATLGKKYGVEITQDHIQNCLDTYRDWLHARSTCPACGLNALQSDPFHYRCHNCRTQWSVTTGHFARPYRRRLSRSAKA
jgi:hypothetical protein